MCIRDRDNVIPYIGGEEEKSEQEPLKIWGHIEDDKIVNAVSPSITSQCIRVPVTDGHTAAVFVSFEKKAEMEEIIEKWESYRGRPQAVSYTHLDVYKRQASCFCGFPTRQA